MNTLISLRNITKKYNKKKILSDINLNIYKTEILGLKGINGSGKTTLLKILAGILTQDKGEVIINSDIETEILLEGSRNFYWNLTGYQNLNYFSTIFGLDNKKDSINYVIDLLDLKGFINELSGSYSRGMQQKLSLAISLLNKPDLLLMDEPTNGLDEETVKNLISILKEINKNLGITIILVSHDKNFLNSIVDRELLIKNGTVISSTNNNIVGGIK
ncbi:ABC transporter ATP-binding protein [Bacillus spizizenii]|nr:ABC transporter ATP-binding protein [Bacillus spizizenii]MCY8125663.1 ABC transporter ATP-binding protein [Bacillus spizizenii]MCY8166587.1 ABC transporter ATP-binding protein [Bacillus spizizenii]MCY8189738.1 ABC transporter ATP-binding protein [Bacillus spizizenii]MCY8226970.1 ABC transporter ATP-binding protein [Bacillus spizizenii]